MIEFQHAGFWMVVQQTPVEDTAFCLKGKTLSQWGGVEQWSEHKK